ncbi:hypothetical protein PHYBLDRAFT_168755 [Phycomyces blakesleeanus NRRL 1555(-)]|uniref:Fungal lipase-type domain-containing protein n=1 Tax=Phycomyces blakesleeanus (strain ATCC 8743b / DSM 1359 / FGSC 10004 / NBRC 33097 / NRRL 1555) TaxID=763407 RepID=A0A162PJ98_PHYB8|nr:hypothetical protein PHYBLDRAFT_168755 [Phycomyces blakesleeanus NRRL 1555(-)]OAD73397.1 hypothetical protein PHYBLDRAFT_168755 [Phycomyces blakesleeanus NRRL 1555(-)]|eukprot:XP_018291437.1 hypothetical protein PHYBLDRAFT_168755 [Phycomyces blakesleeanus NRRL 1555(-)]
MLPRIATAGSTAPKEPNKAASFPSSRLARSFKGVRQLWKPRHASTYDTKAQLQTSYAKAGMSAVAMTLTADLRTKADMHSITLLHPSMDFIPHGGHLSWPSSAANPRAFVHYEPNRDHVAMGSNPDTKYSNSLWLTVDQYAWLIQQLQEEQSVHDALKADHGSALFAAPSPGVTSWGAFIRPFAASPAPMLGVLHAHICTRTLARRLARLVLRAKHRSMPDIYRHCLFMLPKALLLQAATFIPQTKQLPLLELDLSYQRALREPFESLSPEFHQRLLRYADRIALSAHEVAPVRMTERSSEDQHHYCALTCRKCQCDTNLHMALSAISPFSGMNTSRFSVSSDQHMSGTIPTVRVSTHHSSNNIIDSTEDSLGDPTFVVSFSQAMFGTDSLSSCQRVPQSLENISGQRTTPQTSLSVHYTESLVSDTVSMSSFPAHTTSFSNSTKPEKRGYVAVDHQNEEILVVFPGACSSDTLFENVSYTPVPWEEAEDNMGNTTDESVTHERKRSKSRNFKSSWSRASFLKHRPESMEVTDDQNAKSLEPDQDISPWVLDYALTAWRRCELKVATLLMRVCHATPAHYKVVILGHSLGGAVAALCASSLVSTRLLVDRSVTLCTINSPRVGNRAFVNHLTAQNIKTIRITYPSDLMAHLPPRTSGLVHAGSTTVLMAPVDSTCDMQATMLINAVNPSTTEDLLARTFPPTTYHTRRHHMAWDINLCPEDCNVRKKIMAS